MTKVYHRDEFMLREKACCYKLLIFLSANRYWHVSPCPMWITFDWDGANAICTWIFGNNMETTSMPKQTLGYLKNQGPQGDAASTWFWVLESRSGLSIATTLGSWENDSSLSVFLLTLSKPWNEHRRQEAALSPHQLPLHPKSVSVHTMLLWFVLWGPPGNSGGSRSVTNAPWCLQLVLGKATSHWAGIMEPAELLTPQGELSLEKGQRNLRIMGSETVLVSCSPIQLCFQYPSSYDWWGGYSWL